MVDLGTLIHQAKVVRCGEGNYPVLSMTMHDGLVFQNDKFKKQSHQRISLIIRL